jgi:glycosyltransferase involved in cell wall biosynthesis
MKLVIQIPCLNEATTLPLVLKSIPKKIIGIDQITILVIDDGSSDDTVSVAKNLGVTEFVYHAHTMGLARSFQDGIARALELGADIVVNTDGDNQYPQAEIPNLIKPLLEGTADIAIADRQTATIEHFSGFKKFLQKMGSKTVNWAAGTNLPDAASGFRAYSKQSLIRLNTVTRFSYAMETIIQAGNKRMAIASVPITTNPKTRESRLFKSTFEHVRKSGAAIVRAYLMYKPYTVFATLGATFFIAGSVLFLRYLVIFLQGSHESHLQSILLGSVFMTAAFMCFVLGIVADLTRINRILLEDTLEHLKEVRFKK